MRQDTKQSAFHPQVKQSYADSILALAELAAEWMDDLGGDSFGDDPTPNPVEWKSRDGFISHNLGGYSITQNYACGYGSGTYHTAKESDFVQWMANNAWEDYLRDNKLETMPEPTPEEFFDYENSYMEDLYTILEVEMFIPYDDADRVQVSLLAHYRDAPYHRTNKAEVIYCEKFSLDSFNPYEVMPKLIAAYKEA